MDRNLLNHQHLDTKDPLPIASSTMTAPLPGKTQPPITVGMIGAPKMFLEKCSWLLRIMALSHIIDWHIVTFYLLSILAFSRDITSKPS